MGRPKIAILAPFRTQQDIGLAAELPTLMEWADVVVNDEPETASEARCRELLAGAKACLSSWRCPRLTADVLSEAFDLGLVCHAAGSVKPVVSPDLRARGIRITGGAPVIEEAVAEYTLAVILMMQRNLPAYSTALKAGAHWRWDVNRQWEVGLQDATVGIVGLGSVGRLVADYLRPHVDPTLAAEHGVALVSLDELFRSSTVVTLHAPLLPETQGMITRHLMQLLPSQALFVNTARGELVDETALVEALEAGRLRAALDVFSKEPLPPDSPFRRLPNVFITPHLAGGTQANRRRLLRSAIRNLHAYCNGRPLQHEILPESLLFLA